MNKGAYAVIALAIGAVILFALGLLYKNKIGEYSNMIFDNVGDWVNDMGQSMTVVPVIKANLVSMF